MPAQPETEQPQHEQPALTSLDRLADGVSLASDFGAIWAVWSILQVLFGRQSAASALRQLASAGVASLVLTRTLKHKFAVERAETTSTASLARTPTSSSFPSGHTLAAFLSAAVIPRSRAGRYVALGFAALVAWSRVRVGHHRPSDVMAGAAAGSLGGAVLATALSLRATPSA